MELAPGVICYFIPEGFECEIVASLKNGDKVEAYINGKAAMASIDVQDNPNGYWFKIDKNRLLKCSRPDTIGIAWIAKKTELIPLGYTDSVVGRESKRKANKSTKVYVHEQRKRFKTRR